jgi:hypothetical protein
VAGERRVIGQHGSGGPMRMWDTYDKASGLVDDLLGRQNCGL